MFIDALGVGLGCVLRQNGKVAVYGSRQLDEEEQKCATYELLSETIVFP